MAERFINNLSVGIDKTKAEEALFPLYKAIASLIELTPQFVYFEQYAEVVANGGPPNVNPVVGPFGTEFRVNVRNAGLLNNIINPNYVYEVKILDSQISRYPSGIPNTQIATPSQLVYVKIDNLTDEAYDFSLASPYEKENNRIIYLKQKTFPAQLTIKVGHCDTDIDSATFGQFYEINGFASGGGVDEPFAIYYGQNVFLIRFRISVRQIHTF